MMRAVTWTILLGAAVPGCLTTDGGAASGPAAGLELLPRLAGLWSGPATDTPLGSFPLMNMDLRAAGPRVLFSRADLDENNSLRFAFAVEHHGQRPVLVFRNGGLFMGLVRDSRTAFLDGSAPPRFCAIDRGCGYIDARFQLEGDDQLRLEVSVRGSPHLLWRARRLEPRPLPQPFPVDPEPLPGDGPFPPLPRLRVAVSWQQPPAQDAEVWLILSVGECSLASGCAVSRSLSAAVPAGASRVELVLDQIHPGPYRATAILDRKRTFRQTLRPSSGDGISVPNQPLEVAPMGETAAAVPILLVVP